MKNKLIMSGICLVPITILAACSDNTTQEVVTDTTKTIEVLSQSELVQAEKQQESRNVLVENISNTILATNAQFLSIEKLEKINDVPIITSNFNKELQIVYIDNEIEKLNNITANHLSEKELKLVNKLLNIKETEKELYTILYDSWDSSEKKYKFTEKNKEEYEVKRKSLLSFLIENESDILVSTYALIHPEISQSDIKEHLEFQSFVYGLDKGNVIDFEKTLNGQISNIIYHLLSLENDDILKQKTIKEDIQLIVKLQNEYKTNDLYAKNKFVKTYINSLLGINTVDLEKYLKTDDYTSIYKHIQKSYSNMYINYTEQESYLYLNTLEFYLGMLKPNEEVQVENNQEQPVVTTNEEGQIPETPEKPEKPEKPETKVEENQSNN